ncbi:MAG: exodeoxyribonuclease VII small subunit [Ruminococcaceae bacterium]|nr:exodeoxyribonuclease VII small subunit [Oscillospiraceae bacterium]
MDFSKYENMKFEEALRELETIVSKLENQTAQLDESLELYESGIYLVKKCNKMLNDAEQKVSILSRDEDNSVVLKDFVPESTN